MHRKLVIGLAESDNCWIDGHCSIETHVQAAAAHAAGEVRTANSFMLSAFCAYASGVLQYSQMVQGCVEPLLSTKPPARNVSRMTKELQT